MAEPAIRPWLTWRIRLLGADRRFCGRPDSSMMMPPCCRNAAEVLLDAFNTDVYQVEAFTSVLMPPSIPRIGLARRSANLSDRRRWAARR